MLWVRQAEIFPGFDHGLAGKSCTDFDFCGISGDVRGEDPVPPPLPFVFILAWLYASYRPDALWRALRRLFRHETGQSLESA